MQLCNEYLGYLPYGFARKAVRVLHRQGYTTITQPMVYVVAKNKPSTYTKEVLRVLLGLAVNRYQFFTDTVFYKSLHTNNVKLLAQ